MRYPTACCGELHWKNYFGIAIVTRIWHHYDKSLWKDDGLFEHYGVRFSDLLMDSDGQMILESWAVADGFKDFKHADQWFRKHHGSDWMEKDLDVITFEPTWLKPIQGGAMSIKSNKEISFATLLKQGKTKEELMKHFSLSEAQYERIVADVRRIEAEEQAKNQ